MCERSEIMKTQANKQAKDHNNNQSQNQSKNQNRISTWAESDHSKFSDVG